MASVDLSLVSVPVFVSWASLVNGEKLATEDTTMADVGLGLGVEVDAGGGDDGEEWLVGTWGGW